MTQVRTFVIEGKDLENSGNPFSINSVLFAKELARRIINFEREIGFQHKTCQCFPQIYHFGSGGYTKYSECSSVSVILTF